MEANKEQPCMCCYLYLLLFSFLFGTQTQKRCNNKEERKKNAHIFKYAPCTSKPLSSRTVHMSTYVRYFPVCPMNMWLFTHFPMECCHFFLRMRAYDLFRCYAIAHRKLIRKSFWTYSSNNMATVHFFENKTQTPWICVQFSIGFSQIVLNRSLAHISINC